MPSELAAPLIEAVRRVFAVAPPEPGDLMVLGGSTSAVRGERYGKAGDPALALELLEALLPELAPRGVVLAVQGCEHVNRSLVLPADRARLLGLEPVNVVPVPKAGGALAAVYRTLLPDPAVQPKQCMPTATAAWFSSLRSSSSQIVRTEPGTGSSSIWLKSQS